MKWIILVVFFLAVVYLGIGAVAANILTYPERVFATDITPNQPYEDVRFLARDGEVEIAGWYIYQENNTKVVILAHGIHCSRTCEFEGGWVDFGDALVEAGINVLMIDLRGHGQSGDSRFSFGKYERFDVLGAVDWLKDKGYQTGSIGALGASLGGASTIGATAEDTDISALVVDSTFADIYPVIQGQWTNQSGLPNFFLPSVLLMNRVLFGEDLAEARPVEEIGKIAPRGLLIIHCTGDTWVKFSQAEELSAAAPFAETWFVEGCGHVKLFKDDTQIYYDHIIAFFDEHLH
jgi:fermentation-respiration switch protein FrsA (DUF1100 family)